MPTDHPSVALPPVPVAPPRGDSFAPFACPMGHGAGGRTGTGDPSGGEAGPARRGRSGRGYFLPGIIALVVLVAAGGVVNFAGLDHSGPARLAGPDVATFVAQGIQAEQGLSAPPTVTCPASEPVRPGLRFSCQWAQSGGDRTVTVTETDRRGQFRFSVAAGS